MHPRNKDVEKRAQLAIDPGPRSITGKSVSGGADHGFNGGTFKTTVVPLGEIRTDEAGRLLVLGGTGNSASPSDAPVFDPADPDSFNNANDWYDDTSDGPVTATVSIDGRESGRRRLGRRDAAKLCAAYRQLAHAVRPPG